MGTRESGRKRSPASTPSPSRLEEVFRRRGGVHILNLLQEGERSFTEIQGLLASKGRALAPATIAARLREMEEAGLVVRKDRKYALGPAGAELMAAFERMETT